MMSGSTELGLEIQIRPWLSAELVMSADRLNGGGGDSERVGGGKIGISAPYTGDSIKADTACPSTRYTLPHQRSE